MSWLIHVNCVIQIPPVQLACKSKKQEASQVGLDDKDAEHTEETDVV